MDIGTKPGARVRFEHPKSGWPWERIVAKAHLSIGRIYTMTSIDVGQSETRITLREVPGVSFNSVHFDNVDDGEVA
jgi:hypothetical protein